MSKDNLVDVLSFDAVKDAEIPTEVELKHDSGEFTGLTLLVLGSKSDVVTKHAKQEFRKLQAKESQAKKRGKESEPMDIDELEEANIQSTLVRVVGWKGAKQEFDKELLRQAIKRNPHWIRQVLDASEDDANFTKAS